MSYCHILIFLHSKADLNANILEVSEVPADDLTKKLPVVPKDRLPTVTKKVPQKEEDDLDKLQAWAAS